MSRAVNGLKVCCSCRVEKPIKDFSTDRSKRDGLLCRCKRCDSVHYVNHKKEIAARVRSYSKSHRKEIYVQKTAYAAANKDRISTYQAAYRKKYRQKKTVYMAAYVASRRKTDTIFDLKQRISASLRTSLKKLGQTKSARTERILGCSIKEFRVYFESQFTERMGWEEFKKGNIHIDHIVPLATAKTEEDVIRLCHYTNLQPLWASDNIRKSCKINGIDVRFHKRVK